MQAQELSTNTRRPFDVEDYIDILRRHRGWILGPLFAALVASVVVAFLWPDTFVSIATIRVVPPQISENIVPTNVNIDIQGRVNSMVQLILNRATLTNIINSKNLYKKERDRLPLDDVIETMRNRDIRVLPVLQSLNAQPSGRRDQYPAFEIRFSYSNRYVAQQVTQDLVSRFMEESVRDALGGSNGTTQFLTDQRNSAKKKLDAIEQKLSEFRTKNLGRLPEEQQSNYQQLTVMNGQMLNLNTAMNRVNQEKLLYENQLRIYRERLQTLKDPNTNDQVVQQRNEKLAEKDSEIAQLENLVTQARQRYTDTHPDVIRFTKMLANVKKERETLAKADENKKPEAPVQRAPSPQFMREQRDLDEAIQKVQAMIQAKDLEMEDFKRQSAGLDKSIKGYQSRIEGIPVGMREADELLRERDLAKREYENLDASVSKSTMSTAVANQQQGERLEPLDPPSLPMTHTEPKRPLIIAIGSGLGLILGLCLAGAREMKDTALKNLKDVRAYTQLPVLGSIPLLENDLVVRRRKRLAWLAWSTACLVGVVIMSSSVVYYYATKI
jgi:succinoglycan biosynthesis transport protein ExoP